MPLRIAGWASRKPAAEAQTAATAVDELDWMKVFNATMISPLIEIEDEAVVMMTGPSFLLTDAVLLCNDASKSMSSGLKLSEKGTAVEVPMVNQK